MVFAHVLIAGIDHQTRIRLCQRSIHPGLDVGVESLADRRHQRLGKVRAAQLSVMADLARRHSVQIRLLQGQHQRFFRALIPLEELGLETAGPILGARPAHADLPVWSTDAAYTRCDTPADARSARRARRGETAAKKRRSASRRKSGPFSSPS